IGSLFLKTAGIHRPDEVAFVVWSRETRLMNAPVSLPDFQDLRASQRSFSSVSATAVLRTVVASESMSQMEMAEAVDGAYFSTLGVHAAIGRTIQPVDDAGAARVAVLSEKLWRERYGSDPAIVGRSIRIAGQVFDVIGVAQSKFEGPSTFLFGTAIWIPLASEPRDTTLVTPALPGLASPRAEPAAAPRDRRRLIAFGRLAPSVSVERATAELTAIAARLDEAFPPPPYLQRLKQSDRAWRARLATTSSLEDTAVRRVGIALTAFVGL